MLAKSSLNNIEVLNYKVLIDSVISHDEIILINNVVKEYEEMKVEIKNLKTYSSSSKLLVILIILKCSKNQNLSNSKKVDY